MSKTNISWTDETWNPVTGCTKVSPGCKNCYAERMWIRLSAKNMPYAGRAFTDVQCHHDRLQQPLKWRKPRMVFVNSMSDLFHEDVPFEFVSEVFIAMLENQQHTFQILTKRPERMRQFVNEWGFDYPLPNVWLGVSAEDQQTANERIPILLQTPAAVRFVSAEPLLGPIDLREAHYSKERLPRVDWVIVGGESGPKARKCDTGWMVSIARQCELNNVPIFIKQMGSCPLNNINMGFTGKGTDMSEWPPRLQIQEFPYIDQPTNKG